MAAPTRPRNSNPFMAKSPSPSAHRYLGLNVHDFNLTPRNISFPHGSWRDQGRGLRQTHSTSAGVSLALLDSNVRYGSTSGHRDGVGFGLLGATTRHPVSSGRRLASPPGQPQPGQPLLRLLRRTKWSQV